MFSGGKDSVAALLRLRAAPGRATGRLIATVSERDGRVPLHGTPRALLQAQADALGLPLTVIELPEGCDNATYTRRLADVLLPWKERGLQSVAFGDLFLADIRRFRERQLTELGLAALFPLWGEDTAELAEALIADGLEAVVCGVDTQVLPERALGAAWDRNFIAALPAGCDPCGENGEFHTLVTRAPGMHGRLAIEPVGRRFSHDRFCMLDLRLA